VNGLSVALLAHINAIKTHSWRCQEIRCDGDLEILVVTFRFVISSLGLMDLGNIDRISKEFAQSSLTSCVQRELN
jgi:hypothetical protein